MKPPPLFKTTIVIWTDWDPKDTEIETLAREATRGDAYCSRKISAYILSPELDRDWDGTEFFNLHNEDEESKT